MIWEKICILIEKFRKLGVTGMSVLKANDARKVGKWVTVTIREAKRRMKNGKEIDKRVVEEFTAAGNPILSTTDVHKTMGYSVCCHPTYFFLDICMKCSDAIRLRCLSNLSAPDSDVCGHPDFTAKMIPCFQID